MVAPLLPLTAEEVWRGLTGERSVHLTDWPSVTGESDAGLAAAMDRVREVCSTASALRKAEGLRVRLPLASLTVVTDDAASLEPLAGLITDELNVKSLVLTDLADADQGAFGVQQTLQVNARAAGPRLGRDVQKAIKGSKSGDWSVDADGSVVAGGIALVEGEYALTTVVADADPSDQRAVAMLPGGGFVILDCAVTPELAAEGLARDVVRAVQQARRDAGLEVSDRIALQLGGDESVRRSGRDARRADQGRDAGQHAGGRATVVRERLGLRRRRPEGQRSAVARVSRLSGCDQGHVALALTSLSICARFRVSSMTPELCGSGVDPSGRRQQKDHGPVTTFAFILFVTIVFPLLVMTAVTWLISAAYDETSALRRGCGRLEEAWISRRALV